MNNDLSLSAQPREGWTMRRAWTAVLLAALLAHSPGLGLGFMADDFGMQLVMDGRLESASWKPWSLYDFGSFADAPLRSLENGAFPWWTDADWHVRFLRPLSSLSLWLDHALFGSSAIAGHLVSLVLFLLLLFAMRRLYARLGLGSVAALLAVLIFAVDSAALMPVGWIANRNSLLEALFAVLAVHAGLAALERPSPRRVAISLLLATLAVAAKESGLHVFLVLVFLFIRERRNASHARLFKIASAVCVAFALVYTLCYALAGFGSNALFYPMPWRSPLEFARRALAIFICAPLSAVSPFSADVLVLQPAWFWPVLGVALLLGLIVLRFVGLKVRHASSASFLLVWGALALLPQAGAPPSDRLMFTPMLAWSALIALYLTKTLGAASRAGTSAIERRVAWTVGATSIGLSAVFVAALGINLARGAGLMRGVTRDADVGPETLGVRHAFLMQVSPSALIALNPRAAWIFLGGSENVRLHPMQSGQRALSWTRISERRFALETRDDPFLSNPFESVFLTRRLLPSESRVWNCLGYSVRGTAEPDGALRRIEVELESSLDDPRWRFLVPREGRLTHRSPPAIGESFELPQSFKDPLLP